MTFKDLLAYAWHALRAYPLRTGLMALAMAIGVGAVVVLTALADGARRYVIDQFQAIGANLLIALPGRAETSGGAAGMLMGETPRDLTLDDAAALLRLSGVRRIAPLNLGAAEVTWGRRTREVVILGSTADLKDIRRTQLVQGSFLPRGDIRKATPVVVIGAKVRAEIFGAEPAVGEWLRIGDRRFRVIGVMAPQGQTLGTNSDESVIIPVASAQMLFNSHSLFRILIEARSRNEIEPARQQVRDVLRARHEGEEDVTVITQDAIVATFDRILRALTLAVGGIAAISLAVAGILVMNVMLIAVAQRRQEIGLLKAIGAAPTTIRRLFFAEATLLSVAAASIGLVVGEVASNIIGRIYPALPIAAPPWAVAAALATAIVIGIAFSVLPARRAAALDPVLALARR